MDLKFSIKNIMSDKVGSNDAKAPKLLRDVLLNHQAASEQVLQDKAIMEALKPNLLHLLSNNGNVNGDSNGSGSNASSPSSTAAAAATVANSNAAAIMQSLAEQNLFAPYLATAALGQPQQQLGASAALDIFAYCQYISSMMLFKAMANGESPSSLVNGGIDERASRGDKSSSEPGSPTILSEPQDYSLKNSRKLSSESVGLTSFDSLPPPLTRKEHKKASILAKNLLKGDDHLAGSGHNHHSGRKFMSNERRPRQAYNTKQLERLESEFQLDKYLTVSKRIELSCALSLSEVQIKTWFQNRRTKWKKQMIEWRRGSSDSHKNETDTGTNGHHDTNSALSVTSEDSNDSALSRRKKIKAYDFDNEDSDKHTGDNHSNGSDDIDMDMSDHRSACDDDDHESD